MNLWGAGLLDAYLVTIERIVLNNLKSIHLPVAIAWSESKTT